MCSHFFEKRREEGKGVCIFLKREGKKVKVFTFFLRREKGKGVYIFFKKGRW